MIYELKSVSLTLVCSAWKREAAINWRWRHKLTHLNNVDLQTDKRIVVRAKECSRLDTNDATNDSSCLVQDARQVAAGLRVAEADTVLLHWGARQVRYIDHRRRFRLPERVPRLHRAAGHNASHRQVTLVVIENPRQ